jgi:type I restriction enzyme S subunit
MRNKPGWIVYRFEDFVENVREQTMPTTEDSKNYIGLEHLDSGCLHVRRWGTEIPLKGTKFRMKKGDLLFARRNAYLRRVAISPHNGLFSAHGMVFRPKIDMVSADFLPFFLSSDVFMDRAIRISVGSLSPTINWGTLCHEEFSLPPLDEQECIADLLWSVDGVEEQYINLLNKMIICKDSYFNEMYQGKKCEAESVSEIAEINPRIKRDSISGKMLVSFITMADVSEEGFILSKQDRLYSSIKNGFTPFEENDILFAKITPCMENGKGAIALGLTNQIGFGSTEFHVLRPKIESDKNYLFYLTKMSSLRKKAEQLMTGSAGQKRVQTDFFDFYKVKFPGVVQRKLVGEQMQSFEEKIANVKNIINGVKLIKKQIINQMFS